MFIEAVNTVQLRAISGGSDALGAQLALIVDGLRETSDCLSYALVRSHADQNLWIITGHWQTAASMYAHFSNPLLNDLMSLLHCRGVSCIDCNSFCSTPARLAY